MLEPEAGRAGAAAPRALLPLEEHAMAKLIVTFLAVAFCVVLLVDDPQSTGYGVRVALTVGTRVLETAATALDELLRSAAA